jgi:nitroimidazol reductase NimA-like FMN-containing flavoprotein (pyridoxamine 5'-phosphate oxidase superfamily)
MNDRREGRLIMQPGEITEVLSRPLSQELLARDLTRLAYVAKDGTPRSIPIGFVRNGSEIVMCTAENAAKVPALRHNPAVALTIDTEETRCWLSPVALCRSSINVTVCWRPDSCWPS